MEWLEGITTTLGTIATVGSGGIFGLLGAGVGALSKYMQEKSLREWEKEKHKMKMDEIRVKMEVASQEGSWDGLKTSWEAERDISPHVHTWVNDIRALFRPVYTLAILIVAAWVFARILDGWLKDYLTAEDVRDLVRYMVYTIYFTAATAGTWWFAERGLVPSFMKNR